MTTQPTPTKRYRRRVTDEEIERLREALQQIATGKNADGQTVDFFQDIARDALATIDGGVK